MTASTPSSRTAPLRRDISYPGLPMEDGRPPWRASATAHIKRPASAATARRWRRQEKQQLQHQKRLQHASSMSALPIAVHPGIDATGEEARAAAVAAAEAEVDDMSTTLGITLSSLSSADQKPVDTTALRAQRRAEKKAADKAALPSHYSPIKEYHPPKLKYNPRRRTYAHELVVMSETPGAGKYPQPKLGAGMKGGRFSTSKPKGTIEWIQYYARQMYVYGYREKGDGFPPPPSPPVSHADAHAPSQLTLTNKIANARHTQHKISPQTDPAQATTNQ